MELTHRFVETNGIKMHITEQGEGPLVILCHGFPELGYSWIQQLPALAEAGFHAVAPDQRGYGKTDCPESIEDYDIFQLVGDIVGLVNALGEEKAVIVGHDWGVAVASHCALFRPDIFKTVVLMTRPYFSRPWRGGMPTTEMKKLGDGNQIFYISYFQEPGKVESELDSDVRDSVIKLLYMGSGDPPPEKRWNLLLEKGKNFLDMTSIPATLPEWLTEEDIGVFTAAFQRTGFRGGVNWYRNIDRNWALTTFLSGAKIYQPSLFIAGEEDSALAFFNWRRSISHLEINMPNLKQKVLIPGAGHFVQMERPQEVNRHVIEFLNNVK